MSDPTPPLQAADFKDRHAWLVVFGVVLIVLGALLLMLIPVVLFGQMMAGHLPGTHPIELRFIVPSLLMYFVLAIAFIWLGIGSIKCRRWARALIAVISWLWLIFGVMGFISSAIMLPQILDRTPSAAGSGPTPPIVRSMIAFFALGINAVIFVIIPAVLAFFYSGRNVKATCEDREPVVRWTDACPLPVLALSLTLGCSVSYMPLMILCMNSVVPFFGIYLNGIPGTIALLITAVVYGFAAFECYKMKVRGWWTAVAGLALWALSTSISCATQGLLPLYKLAGYPEWQLNQMKQMGVLDSPLTMGLIVLCWLPCMGYVIYIRRYFVRKSEAPA